MVPWIVERTDGDMVRLALSPTSDPTVVTDEWHLNGTRLRFHRDDGSARVRINNSLSFDWDDCISTSHTAASYGSFAREFTRLISFGTSNNILDGVRVAASEVARTGVVHKFGENPSIDIGSVPEHAWAFGGTYVYPQAAETVLVVAGGNANDTAAGSGARTIVVSGLDQNWTEASETITLAGASASSATTTTFIRVFRVFVDTCGTYSGNNTGNIEVQTSTTGDTVAYIVAGAGQSKIGLYTVPSGKTAYLSTISVAVNRSGGASTNASIDMRQRRNADTVAAPFTPFRVFQTIGAELGNTSTVRFDVPLEFPARTDIDAVVTFVSANSTAVKCAFDLILVDDVAA